MITTVEQMLDQLSELYAEKDAISLPYIQEIARAEDEKKTATADVALRIEKLESVIEDTVKKDRKTTVHGTHLLAVWYNGRIIWNTSKLDGYAEAHPEIKAFRTEKEPYVVIRARKD